jgi:hypothetical protein
VLAPAGPAVGIGAGSGEYVARFLRGGGR